MINEPYYSTIGEIILKSGLKDFTKDTADAADTGGILTIYGGDTCSSL